MPKTGKPDTSDAQVMIALYEAQSAHNLGEVMGYIWSSDFPTDFKEFRQSFPQGSNSTEERNLHRALGHFETIGTLYRNNLINEDLLFDWLAVDMVWGRVKGFVAGDRRETGSARLWENFEYMARRDANWKPARSRPAAAKRPAAKRRAAKRPAAKRPAAKRPAAKRPAAKRPAAKRTRPAAAKRARPAAAKRARAAAAKRARPAAAKRTRPTAAKRTRPTAAKRARPAAAKRTRPTAAKRTRTAVAKRAPAAKQTAAPRGRATARRTPAARKRG